FRVVPGRDRVKQLRAARHVSGDSRLDTPQPIGQNAPRTPVLVVTGTVPRSRAARKVFPDRVIMSGLLDLNLIRFFEFYLALIFVVGIILRVRQYLAVLAIVHRLPGRWPRLLQLLATKHGVFLNGRTVWPTVLTLALCLLNTLACHLVWPQAHLTLGYLCEWW